MKAELKNPAQNARNLSPKKETIKSLMLIARINGKLKTVIDARFYMSRSGDGASPVYCAMWVFGANEIYVSGKGKATGHGYHKSSAALQDAIDSAGFDLDQSIDGRGDSAMEEALQAIGHCVGADMSEFIIV